MKFAKGFRADINAEGTAIALKSVEQMRKAHHEQLVTPLQLKELKLGTLLNFGRP
jgi:GxxExxY protein